MAYTKKQQRLMAYNDVITKNKKRFKAGVTLTRNEFINLFGITGIVSRGNYKNVHRSNMKLVQAQTEINMLMRENGLNMRSSDYYSEFKVSDKERTKNTIVRYGAEVDRFNSCVSRLADTMEARVNKKTWGTYNRVPKKRVLTLDSSGPGNAEQVARNRVNQF